MKQMRPARHLLPHRQAQLFETQPGPIGYRFGIDGPHSASKHNRWNRHRLIPDDHAGQNPAAGTERPQALHLDPLWAQVDHVDRAPRAERGLRHAQRFAWEPRFPPAIRQGVIHCPVPG